MLRSDRGMLLAVASATAITASGAALAQERPVTAIEEVVVTARRTAESAQTVPIAVSAVNAESMRRNNIQNVADLQRLVPGMTVNSGVGGAATVALSIRGQVAGDNLLTVDPAVGVYLDEVLIPRGVGLRPAQFDLDSIQVLEGPQGTLFGKNTTGGALLLTTTRPSTDVGGYVDVQLTDYEGRRLTAALNLPIIEDRLLTRLAVQRVSRAPFGRDRRGKGTNSEDTDSVRGSVIWRPMEDVEVFGAYDYSVANGRPQNAKLIYLAGCTGPNQCSGLPLPTALGGPLPRYDANGALIAGTYGLGLASTLFSEVVAEQGLAQTPANLTAAQNLISTFLLGGPNDPGFYDTANALTNTYDKYKGSGGNLQIKVEKMGVAFRSITGYRKTFRDSGNLYSPFWIPGPVVSTLTLPNGQTIDKITAIGGFLTTNSHSFTQEFQIQKQDSEFLDYTLGAFYQSEKGKDGGRSLQAPALSPAAVPVVNDGDITNKSRSVYAQAIYHLAPTIRITGGFRYTHDKKGIIVHTGSGTGSPFANGVIDAVANPALAATAAAALLNPGENCSLDPTILAPGVQPYLTVISAAGTRRFFSRDYSVCSAQRSKTFNSTNWLASVDWRPVDDVMLYAKAATGYKGGGFNLRTTNLAGLTPFTPEKTTEYELGFKSTWLDGRLRVNADAYYTKYTDIQRNQIVATLVNGAIGTASVIGNAAKAKVHGVEGTVTVVPVDGLTLVAAGAYVKGKYDSFLIPVAFNPATGAPTAFNDLSSLAFPAPTNANLPHFQYTLNATYEAPVQWGKATFSANWSWQGAQPFTDGPLKQYQQLPSYGLLNLQASLHVDSWDAEVSIFARNALNKKYFTGYNDLSASFSYLNFFTGEPRVAGVGVRKQF